MAWLITANFPIGRHYTFIQERATNDAAELNPSASHVISVATPYSVQRFNLSNCKKKKKNDNKKMEKKRDGNYFTSQTVPPMVGGELGRYMIIDQDIEYLHLNIECND